jgi:hypothetical protein
MILNTTVRVSQPKMIHPSIFISISSFIAKFSRQNGIHVSPTVMWDGLVANEVSSGWEQQDWVNFFEAKVAH